MCMENYGNIKVLGEGVVPEGIYNNIKIAGSCNIVGSISANLLKISGSCNCKLKYTDLLTIKEKFFVTIYLL